jgi:hypothetical protein
MRGGALGVADECIPNTQASVPARGAVPATSGCRKTTAGNFCVIHPPASYRLKDLILPNTGPVRFP